MRFHEIRREGLLGAFCAHWVQINETGALSGVCGLSALEGLGYLFQQDDGMPVVKLHGRRWSHKLNAMLHSFHFLMVPDVIPPRMDAWTSSL